MIQFVDLRAQHDSIREELFAAITQIVDTSSFIMGPAVKEFEGAFAGFCGSEHAIGVSSGTSALHLALAACGVGPGDEVITAPNTFIATAEVITMRGAKVVFADIDPATYTIDPTLIESAITERTRAIIPVHLNGHPADMDPILDIAGKRGLRVIEDCAQAHGAEYKGRPIGTIGDAGCFSFFPGKNLGALGDAGAVVTSDGEIAEKVRMLRNHGRLDKYEHRYAGYNERIDTLQAAVLCVKLRHLAEWNQARRAAAGEYSSRLAGSAVGTPAEVAGCTHVYHLYVVRHPERDSLQGYLKERGIATGIHYPLPLHLQPAYADLGHREGDFPETEKAAKEILSLPMHPYLSAEQVAEVADAILRWAEQG